MFLYACSVCLWARWGAFVLLSVSVSVIFFSAGAFILLIALPVMIFALCRLLCSFAMLILLLVALFCFLLFCFAGAFDFCCGVVLSFCLLHCL